jgi:hypothetical protein
MKNQKIAWFSALIHVVPSDYEKWLEDLALQGWQIDKIGQWSSLYLKLRQDAPRKYRYVYDMQALPGKDYKATYEQFGWAFIGQMASAFIWRKEYAMDRPESFSDPESLEMRNKRFLGAASVSFFMFLSITAALPVCFAVFFKQLDTEDILQFILGFVLSFSLFAYMGYVMKKIYKNRQR